MQKWLRAVGLAIGFGLAAQVVQAQDAPRAGTVVDIKTDRIFLMDVARAGDRLVAVGERGFAMLSDDGGKSWRAVGTPVNRTLTGVAFNGDQLGVAVGHGGSLVRTEDGGTSWTEVPMEDAYGESLLGVTALGDGLFAAYGAFGMYFDSTDGGRTWARRTVLSEEFDRHISEVILGRYGLLGMVGESGTLARSEDGGANWTEVPSPYTGSYFGVLQARDDSLLAFGMRGSVFRSADRAETWNKVEIGTTTSLNGGTVLSDGRIVLVGNAGLVVMSSDNGQTLDVIWSPAGRGFSAVAEAPDGSLVTAGEAGVGILDLSTLVTK